MAPVWPTIAQGGLQDRPKLPIIAQDGLRDGLELSNTTSSMTPKGHRVIQGGPRASQGCAPICHPFDIHQGADLGRTFFLSLASKSNPERAIKGS